MFFPHLVVVYFLFTFCCLFTLSSGAAPRIFCLIHTATPNHDSRALTIYETWAKRCDGFLFFTNSPMKPEIPHIYWPELNTRDHSWEKIREVFKYVAANRTDYDFYLRADDDAYVIVENARHLVANLSREEDHYLGLKWNFFASHGFADGSCYLLSHSTVQKLVEVFKDDSMCPNHHIAEEDQEIAKCLSTIDIYPTDTRDHYGADRFQHFHPLEEFQKSQDWFSNKYSYYPVLEGEASFSRHLISLHHISPYEMRFLDFLLYRLQHNV